MLGNYLYLFLVLIDVITKKVLLIVTCLLSSVCHDLQVGCGIKAEAVLSALAKDEM